MLIDSDFSHSHGSYGPTHLTEATLVGNGGEISPAAVKGRGFQLMENQIMLGLPK